MRGVRTIQIQIEANQIRIEAHKIRLDSIRHEKSSIRTSLECYKSETDFNVTKKLATMRECATLYAFYTSVNPQNPSYSPF